MPTAYELTNTLRDGELPGHDPVRVVGSLWGEWGGVGDTLLKGANTAYVWTTTIDNGNPPSDNPDPHYIIELGGNGWTDHSTRLNPFNENLPATVCIK